MSKSIGFFLSDFTLSGGTERSSISIVNGLASQSHIKVFLIVLNSNNDQPFFKIHEQVHIIYLNIYNYKKQYIKLVVSLNRSIKSNDIQKLVAVEVMSLIYLIPLFKFNLLFQNKCKLWAWEHFNFTVSLGLKTRSFCRKFAAKHAEQIIVLTQKDVELWKKNLNIKGNINAINNASPFPISDEPYNINSKNIIAIGRLTYQKGFDKLLEIWKEHIHKEGNVKNFKLQIIGSGPDKKLLTDYVYQNNLNESVEFIENTNDVKSYYENASFLAMTSRFEGLPMTLLEAQSFGLPIIAYDCLTGPSEVVSENSGYLVKFDDKIDFINKLNKLISNDDLRCNFSDFAKYEVSKFKIDVIIQKWLKIIK